MKTFECIIIWAGTAGIWVALKLKEVWVECLILEADSIWSSFKKWNNETRFISPSFPSNAFGQVDLNSIHYETSPGHMFRKEHMSGVEYAQYLEKLVEKYDIDIVEGVKVLSVKKQWGIFMLQAEWEIEYSCNYLILAIWEFGFPADGNISGSEHGIHSSKILNYNWYSQGDEAVAIIGWYESSVDSAWGLYKKGVKSHIFCWHKLDEIKTSDPSQVLSLYSLERLKEMRENSFIEFTQDYIGNIHRDLDTYILTWKKGEKYTFLNRPILATGFSPRYKLLREYMSFKEDNTIPELNDIDELKKTSNIFVVGAQVRQWGLIFCFIYKYRLRFWVVALEIAKRLKKDIDYYTFQDKWERQWFYLDNLESCGDECKC